MTTPKYFTPSLFDDLPGIVAGFSARHGGVSNGPYATLNLGLSTDDADAHVAENRRRLFDAAGFSADRLAIAGQVHGHNVLRVTAPGLYPGYDGLVTRTPDLVLCISAADCSAVLLADAAAGVIGACHAGWRGAVAGIVPRTIAAMETVGAIPTRLRVYVSPCISLDHFEVGPEVAVQFDPAFVHHLPGKPKPYVDLKAAVAAQIEATGVAPGSIEVSPHCTYAETDTFFSHRAEQGRTGRMMGFIAMQKASSQ